MRPRTKTRAKVRVAHIIHTTGIGGVETAADRISRTTTALDYRVFALAEAEPAAVDADVVGGGVNSPRAALAVLGQLRRQRPEVVVSSLWRSVMIGGLHRVLHPRTAWVIYVHSTRYTNPVDALVHRLAFAWADRILCDSAAALEALIPHRLRSRAEVVCPDSTLLGLARSRASVRQPRPETETTPEPEPDPAQDAVAGTSSSQRGPARILYWGRVVDSKRLDRSLDLLAALEDIAPGALAFDIISPETATLNAVLDSARERGLPVTWLGSGTAEDILGHAANAVCFLQLSEFEGLAMAVREALALGLVPIVTPVGAIGSYTQDGVNSLHVRDTRRSESDGSMRAELTSEEIAEAAHRLVGLNADPLRLAEMSEAATAVPGGNFVGEFEDAILTAAAADAQRSTAGSRATLTEFREVAR